MSCFIILWGLFLDFYSTEKAKYLHVPLLKNLCRVQNIWSQESMGLQASGVFLQNISSTREEIIRAGINMDLKIALRSTLCK